MDFYQIGERCYSRPLFAGIARQVSGPNREVVTVNPQSNDLLQSSWKKEITLTFEFTAADYFFATTSYRHRHVVIWVLYLICIGFLFLGIALFLDPGGPAEFRFMPWMFLAMPFLCFVIGPLLTWLKVNWAIRTTPTFRGPRTISFREEGMSITTQVSHTDLKWGTFVKVVETKRFFFFFLSPRAPVFVPKRFLPGPEDRDALRHLIRTNFEDKAHLLRDESRNAAH
jgi:hypothetical protein